MRDMAIAAVALIVVLAIPLLHRNPAFEDFIIRLSAMALFATSLNLLVGNTGMVSFGHGMFYGLGAYAFALMMQMTDLLLPVAAVLAVLITTFAAFCVGAICIRLGTHYFAFITLAMQMLFYSVIISWQTFTGGDQGLRGGIPRREIFGFELTSQLHLYQFCTIVAVLGLLALRHVSASPFGQTLRMIRDNENRASFLGHRSMARPALGIYDRRRLRGTGRRAGCALRLGRLSRTRRLAEFRPGDLCRHAGRHQQLPRTRPWRDDPACAERRGDTLHGISRAGSGDRDPGLRARPAPRRARFSQTGLARTLAMKLEIRNLTKAFGGLRAIDDVSLAFPSGSLSAVIGPNGAGKSTFFNLISGAFPSDSGQVLLDGQDIVRLSRSDRMHRGIGRAFQVASCFPTMTVVENLMAAVTAHIGRWGNLSRRFPPPGVRERAEEVMELVGLTQVPNVEAAILSHGDQKLLDIAIALALEPRVLLLDEPTAGMGPEERWRMIERVRNLWEQRQLTLVFIEHDMDIVFQVANTIRVLCYGRVLAEGTPDEIRNNKAVIEAYLGTEAHAT